MTRIARLVVMLLVVGAVAIGGNIFVADRSAALRHDYRLAALGLLALALVLVVRTFAGILRDRRKRHSMAAIPYRTARPWLSVPGSHDVEF
jgi:hypothetical protein